MFCQKPLLYLDLSLADVLIELMRCLTCPVVFFSCGARRMYKRTASPVVRFVIAATVGIWMIFFSPLLEMEYLPIALKVFAEWDRVRILFIPNMTILAAKTNTIL